ncbi:S24 family peptidase [Cronobacter turicensis]
MDLVSHLIAHPSFIYVLRVAVDSMRDAGILDVSLLLVDFSLHAKHNDISVISVHRVGTPFKADWVINRVDGT